jgi:hypothetical protein
MRVPQLNHDSIADIHEDKVVERLLSDPLWRSDMFELYGNPRGVLDRQKVPLQTAPGGFKGDVDVLLCAPGHPEEAVAFELKRVKFGMSALRLGGRPNKLHEFHKAVRQANRLADVGFWRVYLYVITLVDAREQNAGKHTYRGLSSELKSLIASVVTTHGLNPRVGLCDLVFTQPMDYAPFTVGGHVHHLKRLARPQQQSEELTKWVAGIFSDGNGYQKTPHRSPGEDEPAGIPNRLRNSTL